MLVAGHCMPSAARPPMLTSGAAPGRPLTAMASSEQPVACMSAYRSNSRPSKNSRARLRLEETWQTLTLGRRQHRGEPVRQGAAGDELAAIHDPDQG
jgi:hypothetical protein